MLSQPASSDQNINDPNIAKNGGITLGLKFTVDKPGVIESVRFWKGSQNTGPHIAQLWDSKGNLLGSAPYTNETTSGWQEAKFATPITIAAKTTYIAAYHTTSQFIAYTPNVFTKSVDISPLHALAGSTAGGNSVFAYDVNGSSVFPSQYNNQSSFYWIDVVFTARNTLFVSTINPPAPPTNVPAWPADVVYNPDLTIYVAPEGDDTKGDGSISKPFASGPKAMDTIKAIMSGANPPKLPAIAFKASGTYIHQWGFGVSGPLLVTRYGESNIEEKPTLQSYPSTGYSCVTALNTSDLHFQHLRVISDDKVQADYGFYTNGIGGELTFDYCEVVGFGAMGVAVQGAGKLRFHHNYVARTGPRTPTSMSGSGLFTEGTLNPDVQCNIFYHCGWDERFFDINDPNWDSASMFRHGWYEGAYFGATAGTARFNIYIDNMATGHQGRNGGLIDWCVFQSNGRATDAFVSPGWNDDQNGEISNCVVFGATSQNFAYWGGGLTGSAVNVYIHDIVFSGNNIMSGAVPILLNWSPCGYPGAPVMPDGTLPRVPANASARIENISGVWKDLGSLNAAVEVDQSGSISSRGNTPVVCKNINIRKAAVGEKTLSINDFFGTKNDEDSAQILRQNLHNPAYSAQNIIAWAKANVK